MKFFIRLLGAALAVIISSYIIPAVYVESFLVALTVAVVIGILNAILKPLLILLTLPITILTLGLFALVINALLVLIADAVVPGFTVQTFLGAILFSILMSFITSFFNSLAK